MWAIRGFAADAAAAAAEPIWCWGRRRDEQHCQCLWQSTACHVSAVEMHGVIRGERRLHVFFISTFVALHLFRHYRMMLLALFTGFTSFFLFVCLDRLQVSSVLAADVPRGREGVAEVPLHRRAPGHGQPVPAVSSGGFVHHRWEIPLLQPV